MPRMTFKSHTQRSSPAEPISPLDVELGYPCYFPGTESLMETTVLFVGREPRAYVNMVANTRELLPLPHTQGAKTMSSYIYQF
jgi:hypothetical protein